jgi:CheY-like chemotaxis protein
LFYRGRVFTLSGRHPKCKPLLPYVPSINIALLRGKSAQIQAIQELLVHSGFRCSIFEAGRDLIHGISQAPYDMLLVDADLLDIPAIDVIRAVRGARSRDLPIMMLAGSGGEDELIVENGVTITVVYAHGYRLDILEDNSAAQLLNPPKRKRRRRKR